MLRVLVVGTGSIGERHVRCFQSTGAAEVGICEINTGLLRTVADRYGIRRAYARLEDALSGTWHAAVIAVPAHLHIPVALRLAEKGVSLFIEKPLSVSLSGVDELKEKVQEGGLRAAVAYPYRSHPVLTDMRNEILSGRFGDPVYVVVDCGQYFPFYRPAYREIYYRDRATGGGAIQDVLTHLVNAVEWLVGPADRIMADAAHQVLEGVTVEDTVSALTRHGGVMAHFSLNQYQAPDETSIRVVCRRGTVRFDVNKSAWSWMQEPGGNWSEIVRGRMERDGWFTCQATAFLDFLEGRREAPCTIDEAEQTLRVTLAALQSVDSGCAVQVARPASSP